MQIIQSPSPNFNDRKNGGLIDMLILHYTDMLDPFETLQRMQDPEIEVSAHYMIDMNGDVYQLVDEEKRAWHAGLSYWKGITDVNSHSIGIEICNPGHSNGYVDFPEIQMASLITLCHGIIERHNIPAMNIIGHSDIAPSRKIDPGERLAWDILASQKIGFVPDRTTLSIDQTDYSEEDITEYLTKIGYNPNDLNKDKISAFQRHYMPEIFLEKAQNHRIGVVDDETYCLLKAVYQLQLDHRPRHA